MSKEEEEEEEEDSRIIVKVAALRPNGGPVGLLATKVDSLCVAPRVFLQHRHSSVKMSI